MNAIEDFWLLRWRGLVARVNQAGETSSAERRLADADMMMKARSESERVRTMLSAKDLPGITE